MKKLFITAFAGIAFLLCSAIYADVTITTKLPTYLPRPALINVTYHDSGVEIKGTPSCDNTQCKLRNHVSWIGGGPLSFTVHDAAYKNYCQLTINAPNIGPETLRKFHCTGVLTGLNYKNVDSDNVEIDLY